MTYQKCTHADVQTFTEYLESLTSPIDSFLEDHILDSTFYRILEGKDEVGYFAIHESALLTQFFLRLSARRHAELLFSNVLREFGIKSAFIPTCDEFLLSHALDVDSEPKKQAYFFVNGGKERPPAISSELQYRLAAPSDVPRIKAVSGDFLDTPEESVHGGQIHVGFLHGDMVAIGIIIKSRILNRHASIGMFTKETERQKGIGTSTILYLKQTCRSDNTIPVSGCWYYNDTSKRTLEAAGMVSNTRLLRFEFKDLH